MSENKEKEDGVEARNDWMYDNNILKDIVFERNRSNQLIVNNPDALNFEIFESSCTTRLRGYDIQVFADSVNITYLEASDVLSRTALNNTEVISSSSYRKFKHDYTFLMFGENDRRLDACFPREEDLFDNKTPDIIIQKGNEYLVVEFTTTMGNTNFSLQKSYMDKVAAYHTPLVNRNKGDVVIRYGIIVVSSSAILTNLSLPNELMEALIYRYRMSNELMFQLKTLEVIDAEEKNELTELENKTKEMFKGMQVDWEHIGAHYAPFGKDMYDSWMTPVTKEEEAYVRNLIKKEFDRALRESTKSVEQGEKTKEELRFEKDIRNTSRMIENYKNETRKGDRRRDDDQKSIGTFPVVAMNRQSKEDDWADLGLSLPRDIDEVTISCWGKAIDSLLIKDETSIAEVSLNSIEEVIDHFKKETEDTERKKKYNRCKIRLTEEERVILAERGVQGKRLKDNEYIKQQKNYKKLPFSIDVDCTDIERFINYTSEKMFEKTPNENVDIDEVLIEDAMNVWDCKSVKEISRECRRNYKRTHMFQATNLISDIATELAIALKQHCKKDEFLIKKIKNYNCWILIKSVSVDKNIFFSILYKKEDVNFIVEKPFRTLYESDNFLWSEFISMNKSKLTNMIKLDTTIFNLCAFYSETHKENITQSFNKELCKTSESRRMVCLCLLVAMDDKTMTEEHLTMLRYIEMEGFVADPIVAVPEKMIKKFNDISRSRLEVWVINKLLNEIERIKKTKRFKRGGRADRYDGMVNPYTGTKLDDVSQLINLFYLGYIKNKDETPEKNTLSKLMKKILEWEDKKCQREYLGLKDQDINKEPPKHSYSPSFTKVIIKEMKEVLKMRYGNNIMEKLSDNLINHVARQKIEDLATLKASSNFTGESKIYTDKEKYKRSKMIVTVRKIVVEGDVNVTDLLNRCMADIKSKGYMAIDIFRKAQHGGLREIYVMTVESRVVQFIIETLFRTLCSYFEEETMTHPKNKTKIPKNHAKKASRVWGSDAVTLTCSDDAEKWNQAHIVIKFIQLGCGLTEEWLHAFWINGITPFLNKRIMIPPDIITMFLTHTEINTTDEYFKRLFYSFKGLHYAEGSLQNVKHYEKMRNGTYEYNATLEFNLKLISEELNIDAWNTASDQIYNMVRKKLKEVYFETWCKKGQTYVITITGMMQGIIHFGSSLYHSGFLITCKNAAIEIAARLGLEIIVDTVQSSDDSAMMVSARITNIKDYYKFVIFSLAIFKFKGFLSRWVGIYQSPKSTQGMDRSMEFNSNFFFGENIFTPTIKSVLASNTIEETESIASRQESSNGLITGIVENGGSFLLAHFCQVSQAMMNYRLMGSSVNRYYNYYAREIIKVKDPSLGYFLMDHPNTTGLFGFKFTLYKYCKDTNLGILYSKQLNDSKNRDEKNSLEITNAGAFINNTIVSWGNRQKWQRLVKEMDLSVEWLDYYDKHPEALFRRPKTHEEMLVKLAYKVNTPGVASSVSKTTNVCTRVIASSVYFITHAIVKSKKLWYNSVDDQNEKTSILDLISKFVRTIGEGITAEILNSIKFLFPFHQDYDDILDNLEVFREQTYALNDRVKRVTNDIEVANSETETYFSPIRMCAQKWFGFDRVNASAKVFEEQWGYLRAGIKWLRETFTETLALSPFEHAAQMVNFIERLESKKRIVHISGSPTSSHGRNNYVSSIALNFFGGIQINLGLEGNILRESGMKHTDAAHALAKVDQLPLLDHKRISFKTAFLWEYDDLKFTENLQRSKKNTLSTLQYVLKNGTIVKTNKEETEFELEFTPEAKKEVMRRIEANNDGIFGTFVQRQVYKEGRYTGRGIWIGRIDDYIVRIQVADYGLDNLIEKVEVRGEMRKPRDFVSGLKRWCAENNCKNELVMSVDDKSASFYLNKFMISGVAMKGKTPVYTKVEFNKIDYVNYDLYKPKIITKRNTINLIAQLSEKEPSGSVILSYTTSESSIRSTVSEHTMKIITRISHEHEFIKRWVMDYEDLIDERNYKDILSSQNMDPMRTEEFMSEIFINQCRNFGITKRKNVSIEEADRHFERDDDLKFLSLDLDEGEFDFGFAQNDIDDIVNNLDEEADWGDFDLMRKGVFTDFESEEEMRKKVVQTNCIRGLISRMIDRLSKRTMIKIADTGEYDGDEANVELARICAELFKEEFKRKYKPELDLKSVSIKP